MSLTVGGLGLVSLHRPLSEDFFWPQSDIRSILCAIVFLIVSILLAYLTNPSETSFRAYLTEQSFRQHLSRLDDEDNTNRTRLRSSPATVNSTSSSSFHFANRASVSLRTPKHVFHSFGLFTIAAMVPLVKSEDPATTPDRSIISDSWFVGAFGRWWRGGIIEAWYQDFVSRTKDEESWSSGILNMKTLDKQADGLPFTSPTLTMRNNATRGQPPRLRSRDRALKPIQRSSTPPPLPKSASLPLHTTTATRLAIPQTLSSVPLPSVLPVKASLSRTPSSSLFEDNPLISHILSQITSSNSHLTDLRAQLSEFQSSAAASHAQLENEVMLMRERKRGEEKERAEVRVRTRALEEEKRSVEGVKREADKRLKSALAARDAVIARMEELERETHALETSKKTDEELISDRAKEVSSEEKERGLDVENKKLELGTKEEFVSLLSVRAKELEERVGDEKEKLARARGLADERRRVLVSQRQRQSAAAAAAAAAIPDRDDVFPPDFISDELIHNNVNRGSRTGLNAVPPRHQNSADSVRPTNLSLGSLSNFNTGNVYTQQTPLMLSKGYSIFDEDLRKHSQPTTAFSPFNEDSNMNMNIGVSPMSSSLIPSGLISSLDTPLDAPTGLLFPNTRTSSGDSSNDGMSRSFQSDSDMFMEREWRGNGNSNLDKLTSSPKSVEYEYNDRDLFARQRRKMDRMDMQRVSLPARSDLAVNISLSRSSTASSHTAVSESSTSFFKDSSLDDEAHNNTFASNARRWFSNSNSSHGVAKKGLNPAAKVFSLPGTNSSRSSTTPTYDALNPSGLGSSMLSQSTNSSLLRAFAPSPAEREVLQRVLGSSTNASLERLLPSLSDVESIPNSPALGHNSGMLPLHRAASHHQTSSVNPNKLVFPAWLQALPRIRKPNFSPWDDEDGAAANTAADDSKLVEQ